MQVTDNTPQTATNGQSGDFKDGTNAGDDYAYDANGNLILDNNKGITSVTYNYLDKPEILTINPPSGSGGGTVQLIYDAEGNKLQKIFTPSSGSAAITTTYINQFVYQGNDVQYINNEEGRIRVLQPVSQSNGYDVLTIDGNMVLPNGKKGVYDYFIRDFQENVRMILTEETHTGSNECTMETSRATAEDPVFGQPGSGNEVETTRFPVANIPGQATGNGWTSTDIGSSVSRLGNLAASKTGPNTLLKVMAGDVINATSEYYFQNAVTNTVNDNSLTTNVINSLISAVSGSSATTTLTHEGTPGISSQLNGNTSFGSITEPDQTNTTGTNPKAYLTVVFFDERFNYISTGSYFIRVSQQGNGASPLVLANIKAPKNGYAFVYLSNQSDEPVYFDNFQVVLNRGRIIEEDHYYAFGLKIAGISSVKLPDPSEAGNISNHNLYNDKELEEDGGLNWYDYGFRSYDAQIGRFTQLDPLTDKFPELTPYQYASDEPVANVDMDGLEGSNATGLFNDLINAGLNPAMNLIQGANAGANAGKWAVSWVSKTGAANSVLFLKATVSHIIPKIGFKIVTLTYQVGAKILNTIVDKTYNANAHLKHGNYPFDSKTGTNYYFWGINGGGGEDFDPNSFDENKHNIIYGVDDDNFLDFLELGFKEPPITELKADPGYAAAEYVSDIKTEALYYKNLKSFVHSQNIMCQI